ncbi:MAG: carbohydrate ABC transporter permease [Sphaerochaeta sp.]|jgi:raffinose/stachyose/melibiose transport system permease protein|uniref:carbohydrate ABC transporter permease n=1 Tax=Sphaerochaeta sp. TaxID=1972642 RepID=UPI002FC9BDDD
MKGRTQTISHTTTIVSYICLVLFTLVTILPVAWMLYSSFKPMGEIMLHPLRLPASPTWDNYRKAFAYGNLVVSFLNSVLYSAISTAATVLLALAAGFALTKFGFSSSKVYFGLFTLGLLITVNSVITPLFIMETTVGLYNTRLGVLLPYIAFGLPMSVLLATSYVRSVPDALIEAAVIDGATYIQIFWKIILIVSTPVLATMAILSFLGNWNEFLMVFTLTSGEDMRSLPVAINSFAGRLNEDYGLQFAALVVGTIPMFVLYLVAHESVIKGFGEGALKE